MFCTKCGKEIRGSPFCQQCGEKSPAGWLDWPRVPGVMDQTKDVKQLKYIGIGLLSFVAVGVLLFVFIFAVPPFWQSTSQPSNYVDECQKGDESACKSLFYDNHGISRDGDGQKLWNAITCRWDPAEIDNCTDKTGNIVCKFKETREPLRPAMCSTYQQRP